VRHLGGLDYELYGSNSDTGIRLRDLPEREHYWLWRILGLIAELGQHFPDEAASTPRVVTA
jgi:hypothetical protein